MPKNLIIDHLIGVYCPMIDREALLTESEKPHLFGVLQSGHTIGL